MQILDFFKNNKHYNERLNCVVEMLVKTFKPSKIYIFGSFAKGSGDEIMNDIDLFVVAETDLRFTDRIKEMKKLCTGEPHVSPLMYTKAEVEQMLEEGEGYIEDVLEEAILIYEDNSSKE